MEECTFDSVSYLKAYDSLNEVFNSAKTFQEKMNLRAMFNYLLKDYN